MAKRIYIIVGVIAMSAAIYFVLNPHHIAWKQLLWIVTLLYAIVIAAIHGTLAHSLTSKQKGNLIFYPLAMGALFTFLVYIYIYIVLPQIIPDFLY